MQVNEFAAYARDAMSIWSLFLTRESGWWYSHLLVATSTDPFWRLLLTLIRDPPLDHNSDDSFNIQLRCQLAHIPWDAGRQSKRCKVCFWQYFLCAARMPSRGFRPATAWNNICWIGPLRGVPECVKQRYFIPTVLHTHVFRGLFFALLGDRPRVSTVHHVKGLQARTKGSAGRL